jgi:dTDP-4-dehydrorhamnose reductase
MTSRPNNLILITGADGQVGQALQSALPTHLSQYTLWPANRAALDLAAHDLAAQVVALKPAAIINAAAYTAVDKAESERDAAFAINAEAPRQLAKAAAALGVPLIHYSTDYVFDGVAKLEHGAARPWREDDPVAPLNVYGESKLAGEVAIAEAGAAALTLRTSWVYAPYGKNFLLTMLRLGAAREEMSVVSDQVGAPTTAAFIAQTTASLLRQALQTQDPCGFVGDRRGVYHLTMAGAVSWFQFAQEIFSGVARAQPGTKTPRVLPINTEDYPTPAKRPQYSVLDNGKLNKTFGARQQDWHSGLAQTLSAVLLPLTK